MKYLFMDLDGTIIETKSGKTFAEDSQDWKFKPGVLQKIAEYSQLGFEPYVVTNQGGVDHGYQRPSEIRDKVKHVLDEVSMYIYLHGSSRTYINSRICVGGGENRKPDVASKFTDMDISPGSIMVGDASGLEREIKDQMIPEYLEFIREYLAKGIHKGKKKFGSVFVEYSPEKISEAYIETNTSFSLSGQIHDKYYYKCYRLKKDFSDSDKVFAEKLGVHYLDIDEFLK